MPSELVGHVLCLLPVREPTPITDRIKRRFPQLEFTYLQFALSEHWKKGQDQPESRDTSTTFLQNKGKGAADCAYRYLERRHDPLYRLTISSPS
jgi:hypothetical protein